MVHLNVAIVLWTFIALIAIIIEAVTTQLITIWFAIASIISAIMCACGIDFKFQLIQFIMTGIILLLIFRPLSKKFIKNPNFSVDNVVKDYIGKDGIVTEVKGDGEYEIKVNGDIWSAKSIDHNLKLNDKVTITALKGVKLTIIKDERNKS